SQIRIMIRLSPSSRIPWQPARSASCSIASDHFWPEKPFPRPARCHSSPFLVEIAEERRSVVDKLASAAHRSMPSNGHSNPSSANWHLASSSALWPSPQRRLCRVDLNPKAKSGGPATANPPLLKPLIPCPTGSY